MLFRIRSDLKKQDHSFIIGVNVHFYLFKVIGMKNVMYDAEIVLAPTRSVHYSCIHFENQIGITNIFKKCDHLLIFQHEGR